MAFKKAKTKKPTQVYKKLPSVWQLVSKSWFEIATFWKPLLGVIIVYGIIYFILVMGFSFASYVQDPLVDTSSKWLDATASISSLLSNGALIGSGQTDTTVLLQFLLFLIASMAFIWTLRKLQGLKKIKTRDAYYAGTASLIPTILVSFVLLLSILPAIAGSGLLAIALQNNGTSGEIIIISIITGLLLLLTVYLLAIFWPAFYIVSLPHTRPFQALKSSAKITKKRRLNIIRKLAFLLIICTIILFAVLFPFALLWPASVPYIAYALLFMIFGFAHVYLYSFYRSLL